MKYLTSNKDIGQLVRDTESTYVSGGGIQMSKYVNTDHYDDIQKIYAYLGSRHTSGEYDSLKREKPFFNIVLAARNIYYRATDTDRKNINVRADNMQEDIPALFATAWLTEWMRREHFGSFLNNWGIELAGFNSAVVKFVESNGELHSMVVPWSRIIFDPINFDANPKIEILELTEAELYRRVDTHGYDKEMVEKLCEALTARELLDHTQQDQKSSYIKLYEVHGYFSLATLTGKDKDEKKYAQQMHVISFVASKEKGEYDDYTLVSGREEKDPYMLTALLPATDGSVSLDGSVKNLFQAQWMVNHEAKSIKDQLDIASKNFYQTADPAFLGRNVVDAIQYGQIVINKEGTSITPVNTTLPNIVPQESFMNMWKSLSAEINGISESMLGQTPPSGSAWRQVQTLLAESHSLFELMTENKGLDIERMIRTHIIPFAKKKMKNKDEIMAVLSANNLAKIDAKLIPARAVANHNRKFVQSVLDGEIPSPYDQAAEEGAVQKELQAMGDSRPLSPGDINWDELLKDIEWNLEFDVTGEPSDKQAVLSTLSTVLGVIANPNYANNPQAQFVVAKALRATGTVSPAEFASIPSPVAPVGGQVLPNNLQPIK